MKQLFYEGTSSRKWYLAVVLYFITLGIVLYFIGTLVLPTTTHTEPSTVKSFRRSKVILGKPRTTSRPVRRDQKDDLKSSGTVHNDASRLSEHNNQSLVIMCLIFTTIEQYDRKALAVKLTWAKRCNYYAFFYSKKEHVHLDGAYALDVPEGREHLTAKTMKALSVAYEKYGETVDWYLKADDDTYFIMENLRHLLSGYDSNRPVYLGHKSMDFLKKGYNSGGAGYLLSKAAMRTMVEKADAFPESCHVEGGVEDFDVGRCLETFRIFPVETRDEFKRVTFHPDHPLKLLLGDLNSAYQYSVENFTFGNPNGIKVLSPDTVSFHYMEPGHMYMYDFLLYHLHRHQTYS